MTAKTKKTLAAVTAASIAGMLATTAAPTMASAANLKPVIGCSAPGGKQEGGALIGAILGGVLGSNLAKNDRGTGTVIGAVGGAAAGSAIGCKMQEKRTANEYGGTYKSGGYKLASYVQPARFDGLNEMYVATSTVNVRAAPTTRAAKTTALTRGQTFKAMAVADRGEWILVGRDGVGIGYVHADYVRPQNGGYRYASY